VHIERLRIVTAAASACGYLVTTAEVQMKTRVLPMVAIGLWLTTIAVAVVLFVRGQAHVAPDGRRAILLEPDQRNLVLQEMRGMLGSVQGVVAGVQAKDMKQVAQAARASGMAAAADVDPALMAKLPLDFKQLGMSVHRRFDELAVATDSGASQEQLLTILSTQLSSCVACHASYRLDATATATK
jgi:cytochrome c556